MNINTINCGERSKQGMTLVEVLISLVILAGVLGGNAALFAKCNIFVTELKEQSIVNSALNERMEEVRNMSYNSIKSLPASFPTTGFSELRNPIGLASSIPFSNVEVVPGSNNEGRKVTLTVSWDSFQGRAISKSLSAHFTKDGISARE